MRLIVIGCLVLLTSCYQEVDIDLPAREAKLVVSSFITTSDVVEVNVGQTQASSDTLYSIEGDCQVKLESNQSVHKLKKVRQGVYQSDFKPEYLVPYKVTVVADGYDTVWAKDSIPMPISFTIGRYIPTANINYEGENVSSIVILLENIPKDDSFFELRLKSHNAIEVDGVVRQDYNYEYIYSKDIIFRNEGVVNETESRVGLLFTNELIDTPNRSVTIEFFNDIDDEYNAIDEVEVELRTVSYSYFMYKKKLYLNIDNQVGDVWDATGNPVEAFTNIHNGYGIVAGYSQVARAKLL